jgi:hypothetical protein
MGYLEELKNKTKEQLINDLYNDRVAKVADYNNDDDNEKELGKYRYGKRVPYLGWFWRYTDFVDKSISIGDDDGFVGVMENNKWGYRQRSMTEQEVDTFVSYLECAFALADDISKSDRIEQSEVVFSELWNWFQILQYKGEWCDAYDYDEY